MSKRLFKSWVLAVVLAGLAWVASLAAEESVAIKLADLPPKIKNAVHKHAGKAKIDGIQKVTDDGEISYEVEIGRGPKAHSFTLDENGELLDLEISLAEAPPAIQEAAKKAAGSGSIEGITKVFDDGEISYDVDITKDGKERTFTFDDKGKLTELEVLAAELPLPVRQTMEKTLAGGQLGDITKEFDEDGTTYEVEINPDANARTITIDEKGAIVSDEVEVDLAATPEAVQKAIKDLLKGGEVGGITKTTDELGVNYDVDLKRAGRWDMVIIGPDGKAVE